MDDELLDGSVDVAILGGGVAGLTLALELHKKRPGTTVVVLERQPHPVPETTHKVGESTVEVAGYYLREVLGMREHLDAQQLHKFGLRVFFSDGDNRDITTRRELGHSLCPPAGVGTYQLDRGRLENALGIELGRVGVPLLTGHKVSEVVLGPPGEAHQISVTDKNSARRRLAATWVVDATGRTSLIKRKLGLEKKVAHNANAVWFRLAHPMDIDGWSDDPAWHSRIQEGRRELSTNHLMGPGYWVWLIRLASDAISVGIVTDPSLHPFEQLNTFDRAMQWLADHEPQCAEAVEEHRDTLQDFRVMTDYSYSCEKLFSEDRWCLAGEAGVFLDPLYSPGLDLIAISNGLIVDLLAHALDGEDVSERAAIHNEMFLLTAEGWLRVYEDQYALMGSPRVMLTKIVWDTAVYWAVPGLLYFNDRFKDLADLPSVVVNLARFSVASQQVQQFLREWAALEGDTAVERFFRFYDFEFMEGLHRGMTVALDDAALEEQFADNVGFIEQLSGQLVATVIEEFESDSGDDAKQAQVARWREDLVLAGLLAVHEQQRHARPIDDLWITQRRAAQPVLTGEPR